MPNQTHKLNLNEPRAAGFRPAFKFALRPHHVWKYGRHPICSGWD